MHGALGLHVLPEELHPHIHQLGGIQSAAAVVGVVGGMGGNALKAVFHLQAGGVGAGGDLVGVPGVPGQGGIQIPEHPVPSHEGLSGAALLPGAAVEHHGSGEIPGGDGFLHCQCGTEGGGTQQVVTAALSAGTVLSGGALGCPGLLGQTGQGIKFPQNPDHRLSAAEAAAEGGGQSAQAFLNGKALLPEQPDVFSGRFVFQHGKLGICPDFVAELTEHGSLRLNDVK